jgi:hypothetical protein
MMGESAIVVGSVFDSAVALVTLDKRMKANNMTMMPREKRQERPSFCLSEIRSVKRRRSGNNITHAIVRGGS